MKNKKALMSSSLVFLTAIAIWIWSKDRTSLSLVHEDIPTQDTQNTVNQEAVNQKIAAIVKGPAQGQNSKRPYAEAVKSAEAKIDRLYDDWRKKPIAEQQYDGKLLIQQNEIMFDEMLGKDHPKREFFLQTYTEFTANSSALIVMSLVQKKPLEDTLPLFTQSLTAYQEALKKNFTDNEYYRLTGLTKDVDFQEALGLKLAPGQQLPKVGPAQLGLYKYDEKSGKVEIDETKRSEFEAQAKESMYQLALEKKVVKNREEFEQLPDVKNFKMPLTGAEADEMLKERGVTPEQVAKGDEKTRSVANVAAPAKATTTQSN